MPEGFVKVVDRIEEAGIAMGRRDDSRAGTEAVSMLTSVLSSATSTVRVLGPGGNRGVQRSRVSRLTLQDATLAPQVAKLGDSGRKMIDNRLDYTPVLDWIDL